MRPEHGKTFACRRPAAKRAVRIKNRYSEKTKYFLQSKASKGQSEALWQVDEVHHVELRRMVLTVQRTAIHSRHGQRAPHIPKNKLYFVKCLFRIFGFILTASVAYGSQFLHGIYPSDTASSLKENFT